MLKSECLPYYNHTQDNQAYVPLLSETAFKVTAGYSQQQARRYVK